MGGSGSRACRPSCGGQAVTQAALWTMVVIAACAGWTVGSALEGVPSAHLALVGALAVLEMGAFRRLDAVRRRLMAVGELAGLLIIAMGSYLFVSLLSPAPLSSAPAGMVTALVIWLLASNTAADLEAVIEPSDTAGGPSGPVGRLAGRMLLVGLGLTLAVVLAGGPLAPPTQPRAIRSGLIVPYFVYWVIGVGALSGIHKSRNLARWRRDQAAVDPDLSSRWSRSAGLWLLATVSISALLWWLGERLVSIAHPLSSGALSAVTGWVASLLNPDRPSPRNQVVPSANTTLPEAADPGRLIGPAPAWLDAFLLLGTGLLFAYAYLLFSRRSRRTPKVSVEGRQWLSSFWSVIAAIGSVLAGLWRSLSALFRRRGGTPIGRVRMVSPARPPAWLPPDAVRRRIASNYRRFVRAATDSVGSPHVSETPAEYARRVDDRLVDEPAVGQLSELYAEARFSAHHLYDDDAGRAATWRDRLVKLLEQPDEPRSDS